MTNYEKFKNEIHELQTDRISNTIVKLTDFIIEHGAYTLVTEKERENLKVSAIEMIMRWSSAEYKQENDKEILPDFSLSETLRILASVLEGAKK